jgi:L-ribulose-5-phosphate 3-epimerase
MHVNRREFGGVVAAGLTPAVAWAQGSAATPARAAAPEATWAISMFSKHLPDLHGRDLGRAVHEAGFDGVDLTVRGGGHVLPTRVADDLPKTVAAIADGGSRVTMLTTELTQPGDPTARAVLAAAAAVDVRRLKAGYYRYAFADVTRELETASVAFRELVGLAAAAGVTLAYHNHSGYIGAPVWDALRMIDGLPARATGLYFDVRHATVEGGQAGWRVAMQRAAPHLRMLAMKDFYWDRGPDGRWRVVDCPIGDGMVDWKVYLAEVRAARFAGPISLHVEYETGGRTPVEKRENMLVAMVRDRTRLAALIAAGAAGAPAPADR